LTIYVTPIEESQTVRISFNFRIGLRDDAMAAAVVSEEITIRIVDSQADVRELPLEAGLISTPVSERMQNGRVVALHPLERRGRRECDVGLGRNVSCQVSTHSNIRQGCHDIDTRGVARWNAVHCGEGYSRARPTSLPAGRDRSSLGHETRGFAAIFGRQCAKPRSCRHQLRIASAQFHR
jgi:hypothetical protein